jgi:pyruvate-ferredoxin/flavodoxin oxidoreductase
MKQGMTQQKLAAQCGHWPLFRHDPRRAAGGQNALRLDSKPPSLPFAKYAQMEMRYKMLERAHPEEAHRLQALAQQDVDERWKYYEQLVTRGTGDGNDGHRDAQLAGTATGSQP